MVVVPVRQYLDETVATTLRDGMKELVKIRPEDPHAFLARYLMKHKPNQNADADDDARREKRSRRKSSDGNKEETGIEEERKE